MKDFLFLALALMLASSRFTRTFVALALMLASLRRTCEPALTPAGLRRSTVHKILPILATDH